MKNESFEDDLIFDSYSPVSIPKLIQAIVELTQNAVWLMRDFSPEEWINTESNYMLQARSHCDG